jgi:hypothetical protein
MLEIPAVWPLLLLIDRPSYENLIGCDWVGLAENDVRGLCIPERQRSISGGGDK